MTQRPKTDHIVDTAGELRQEVALLWQSEKADLLERTELQWRIKRVRNARTYHVFVMYEMERNTAERPVVTRAAKTWKSRVNATTRRVH
jgi:hypothetical protein